MTEERFVAALAKHLPPSASTLRLADIDGRCGPGLSQLRADLQIEPVSVDDLGSKGEAAFDAVVALDGALDDRLLDSALAALRPGGRFIGLLSDPDIDSVPLDTLEARGFVRVLVEAAVDGQGLLLRGERAHDTADTLKRVRDVAATDADLLDLSAYRKPYLHLLVRQSPNKPAWKLAPDEALEWRALALPGSKAATLLAFSSLPKAVAFLQAATLAGATWDINKVGKFARVTIAGWRMSIQLNPAPDTVVSADISWLYIDPDQAATPDE